MKQNVSNRIFKILFILFLFALGVNLLSYAIEAIFGLELYCFGKTSFTIHFALWAVCCICGPTALLLNARRMAIAAPFIGHILGNLPRRYVEHDFLAGNGTSFHDALRFPFRRTSSLHRV